MKIRITKYEPYPSENPTSVAVGFTAIFANGKTHYADATVALDTDEKAAISAAWEAVKASFDEASQRIGGSPSLLGSVWDPEAASRSSEYSPYAEPQQTQIPTVTQIEVQAGNYTEQQIQPAIVEETAQTTEADSEEPVQEAEAQPSQDYSAMTVSELRELARERGLTGYSSMTKAELIELHTQYDEQH
jgi:hypothetical protein